MTSRPHSTVPGSSMLLRSGKVKGETAMTSKLSKYDGTVAGRVSSTRTRMAEGRNPLGGGETKKRAGMETEGGRMQTDGRRKSSKVRGINENNCHVSSRRDRRRPRHEFGVDSLKLTKLTLSDNIEAFMKMFKRSMEAHEIECGK